MQSQMFITAYDLLEKQLWYTFCELRGIDLFAVHKGKIKECRKFRLSPYEIRKLGLDGEVQKCPQNLR